MNWPISGFTPIGMPVLEFFRDLGCPIYEMFGQIEGAGAYSFSNKLRWKIGTAGKPISGCTMRIDDDREIAVKGPNICNGYYKVGF